MIVAAIPLKVAPRKKLARHSPSSQALVFFSLSKLQSRWVRFLFLCTACRRLAGPGVIPAPFLGQPQHRAPRKSGRGGVLATFVVVRSRSVCFRGTLVALDRRVRGWSCGIRARNLCEFLSAAARPRRGGVRRASRAVALLVYIEGRAGTGVADGPSAVADGRLLGCHCFFKGIRCRPRTAHSLPPFVFVCVFVVFRYFPRLAP